MKALALLLLAAMVVAGCSAPPPPARFTATGTSPVVMQGYDYAALTAQPGEGSIRIDVDPAADTGSVEATFPFEGRQWRVRFAAFAQAAPYQEGGVRNGFPEHGASGNGDALLPGFPALSAGWGTGTVEVDGQPYADPFTGNGTFSLHYMVADAAPRDPATLKATKADGAADYDPATPADARLHNGTRQILLNVRSPGTLPPEDASLVFSDTVSSPQYARDFPVPVNATARLLVNLTVTNPTPLPTVGRVAFVLTGPDGNETGRYEYDPVAAGPEGRGTGSIEVPEAAPGAYTLSVAGVGASVTYSANVVVNYADAVFLHVVYTDVATP